MVEKCGPDIGVLMPGEERVALEEIGGRIRKELVKVAYPGLALHDATSRSLKRLTFGGTQSEIFGCLARVW